MSNHLPSQSDIEGFLRENPSARAQVSARGAFNSASLPDALRLKTEAIELRKQLVQNKASLDAYESRREQSKKQIEHAEKTLAALRQRKATAPTATAAPPAGLTGLARTAAAFARDASPKPPAPCRPSTAPLTGIARTVVAFRRNSAK